MVSKKDRTDIEEQNDIQEDFNDLSEESFDRDIDNSRNPSYISADPVNDIYEYKRMRLIPNSESEFIGLVDKDVVLGNVQDKKPNPEYLRILTETIVAMDVFSKVETRRIVVKNSKGINEYKDVEVLVKDGEFDIIRSFLRASLKSDLTLSRAMGKDREAVLDRTQSFNKEIKKSSGNSNNKYGGN
jgi:hypothetical protein